MSSNIITPVLNDVSKFDKQLIAIHAEMCKVYKYSSAAKLAKGEFYKFLGDLKIPEKSHREIMNKLFKADCINAKSILGLVSLSAEKEKSIPQPPKKKVVEEIVEEEEVQDEEVEEAEEDEEEPEPIPVQVRRKIKHKIRDIQDTSLVECFRTLKFVIMQMEEMEEEDFKYMTFGDMKAIIKLLKVTNTSMRRVAEKYFPEREFKRIKE